MILLLALMHPVLKRFMTALVEVFSMPFWPLAQQNIAGAATTVALMSPIRLTPLPAPVLRLRV
jgi:hypothetical protein